MTQRQHGRDACTARVYHTTLEYGGVEPEGAAKDVTDETYDEVTDVKDAIDVAGVTDAVASSLRASRKHRRQTRGTSRVK